MTTICRGIAFEPLRSALLVTTLLVSACATQDAAEPVGEADFTGDSSYHLMMAEIAVQRAQFAAAAQEYYRAAALADDPELARRATEFADEYGFEAYALSSARRWLALDRESLLAHEYLGRLNLGRNDVDAAYEHFEAVLGVRAERSDADYLLLSAEINNEDNAAGVAEIFRRLADENPESAGAHAGLAGAALRVADFDGALSAANRADELGGEWPQVVIIAARALVASGDVEGGLARIGELAVSMPGLPLELEIVRLLAAAGLDQQAMERLNLVAMRYSGEAEVLQLRGLLSLQAGDLDAAEADFSELLANGENVYESYYYLGRVAIARRKFLDAVSMLERVSGGPFLVPARVESSRVHVVLGDPETGLDVLRQFETDYPREAVHVIEPQAQILVSMNRYEDALAAYDKALEYRPESPDLYLGRGALLERMSEVDRAVGDFQQAARLAPESATVLNALGYTLANRTRRYREARRLIEKALKLDPDNPAIVDSMGWVLFRQGKLRKSREYLERAWQLLPDPEVAAHLGEVLWALGERDEAQTLWAEALEQNPESEPLNETMERLID